MPFSCLVQVSEFPLSAKLTLSLEGDKRLAEQADDMLGELMTRWAHAYMTDSLLDSSYPLSAFMPRLADDTR